jgi:hypothetical protein
MQTAIAEIKSFETAKHTRLVSFENSNSWLKRHDDEGTLVIQAGYKLNPNAMEQRSRDEQNPIVVVAGQPPRMYGVKACTGNYTPMNGLSKIETARDSFTACLRQTDHERDLVVVASHWDVENLKALETALKGQYNAMVNGHEIRCNVISVVTVEEGLGSYHAVKSQLKPGSTLLVEMGFGTCELWLVDECGNPYDGRAIDKLGISSLCSELIQDAQIRSLSQDNANAITPAFISRYLADGHPSRINADVWDKLKAQYATEHLKRLQAEIKNEWASKLQDVPNIVFTGGGAALLASIQPKLRQVFIIPDRPQTASVRGSYDFQLSKV